MRPPLHVEYSPQQEIPVQGGEGRAAPTPGRGVGEDGCGPYLPVGVGPCVGLIWALVCSLFAPRCGPYLPRGVGLICPHHGRVWALCGPYVGLIFAPKVGRGPCVGLMWALCGPCVGFKKSWKQKGVFLMWALCGPYVGLMWALQNRSFIANVKGWALCGPYVGLMWALCGPKTVRLLHKFIGGGPCVGLICPRVWALFTRGCGPYLPVGVGLIFPWSRGLAFWSGSDAL